jgi:phosphatidylinositol-3-phosphatase
LGLACSLSMLLAACTGSDIPDVGPGGSGRRPGRMLQLEHVWVFIMGGGGGDLIGNPEAPYANHLASTFGYASDVYAAGHPSLPNHLAVISGSTFGCGSESCPLVRTETLVGQVQRSGIPWAAFLEDLPSTGYLGPDVMGYERRRNPFVHFEEVTGSPEGLSSVRPLTEFQPARDPYRLTFVVPARQHTADGGSVRAMDRWLRRNAGAVLASEAFQDRGALFIAWVEGRRDDRSGCCLEGVEGGRVPLIVAASEGRRAFVSHRPYSIYSLPRTIESALRLPPLEPLRDAGVESLREFWINDPAAIAGWPQRLTASGLMTFAYGDDASVGGFPATRNKPESKLFFTRGGRWWAVLGIGSAPILKGVGPPGVYLLELVEHAWVPRLRLPGADPWERADVRLDGRTVYVALRDNQSIPGNPRRSHLYVLRQTGTSGWDVVSGPILITSDSPETISMEVDSQGRVWVTYRRATSIVVGRKSPRATSFSFSTIPGSHVSSDDIAAVTSFGTDETGYKIGVIWSDQVHDRFVFATRRDEDPIGDETWNIETAYGEGVGGCPTVTGDRCADDHINMKAVGDRVFAVVKTSLSDSPRADLEDPLVVLLHRDASGIWSADPVATVADRLTRPIVLLAPKLGRLYVFAEKPWDGTYVWRSPLDSPAFDATGGLAWTVDPDTHVSDPTSTAQPVTLRSGTVVVSSSGQHNEYWQNEFVT